MIESVNKFRLPFYELKAKACAKWDEHGVLLVLKEKLILAKECNINKLSMGKEAKLT